MAQKFKIELEFTGPEYDRMLRAMVAAGTRKPAVYIKKALFKQVAEDAPKPLEAEGTGVEAAPAPPPEAA